MLGHLAELVGRMRDVPTVHANPSKSVAGYCRECGSLRAISVIDHSEGRARAERFAKELMRDGLQVRIIDTEESRRAEWNCAKSGTIGCPLRNPQILQADFLA